MSPREVAAALAVSETTVKRWVDEGRLPARRTEGGHRRILVADVLQYASQRNWPHVNLGELMGPSPGNSLATLESATLAEQLQEALTASDADRARSLILHAHQQGYSVAQLGDEVIAPVMGQIGHAWACGEIDVYEEHRATQTCLSAILGLKARLDASNEQLRDRPLAVGGGPEKDHYLLANLLIEMTLREAGWRVMNIGPNTPFESFVRAIDQHQPRLLWLSCSHIDDVNQFVAGYRRLYAHAFGRAVAVSVGGRALTQAIREQIEFTQHGDRLAHLIAFARQTWSTPRR